MNNTYTCNKSDVSDLFYIAEHAVYHHTLMHKIPEIITQELKKTHALIAGGAITSAFSQCPIQDYDIYFYTHKDSNHFIEFMKGLMKHSPDSISCSLCNSTHNALTYVITNLTTNTDITIQVITKYTCEDYCSSITDKYDISDAPVLLHTFDFTVCMSAFDVNEGKFILYKDFLVHLCAKKLIYNTRVSLFPICSLLRMLKYLKKGFSISGVEVVKLSLAICNVTMNNYNDLREQLMGIDTSIFAPITDSLINTQGGSTPIDFGSVTKAIDDYLKGHNYEGFEQ